MDGQKLERRLYWLIGLRLVAITGAALPYSLLQLARASGEWRLQSFDIFAGLMYLASLSYIVLLRLVPQRPRLVAHLQFAGDLLGITGLVYLFGGPASPFSMIYLVVIAVAATLVSRRDALIVAAAGWLLYAGLGLGLHLGWIAPFGDPADGVSSTLLVYNLSMHFAGFLAVAHLTSFLAETGRRAERELQRASQTLSALEGLHRNVVQSMPSGLATADASGIITSVNRSACEILGRPAAELVGISLARLGLGNELPWDRLASDLAGANLLPLHGETTIEVASRARQVGYTVSRLTDDTGTRHGTMVLLQDLTPLRHLQEELRVKDRLAAAGELAAGLAHEIGNPLAAISGSVQMLAHESPHGGDSSTHGRRQLFEIVLRESERLDRTLKAFLQFARPRERSPVHFDVARLLREHVELLGHSSELLVTHHLETTIEPASAILFADPDQVSQILWNLSRNALRAMPGGGCLRLEGTLVAANYRIVVDDQGRGMDAEERSTIFRPFHGFFAGGTGVGMAIVDRIVEEHGGTIAVTSEAGKGTRVVIELPMPAALAATRRDLAQVASS